MFLIISGYARLQSFRNGPAMGQRDIDLDRLCVGGRAGGTLHFTGQRAERIGRNASDRDSRLLRWPSGDYACLEAREFQSDQPDRFFGVCRLRIRFSAALPNFLYSVFEE